MNINRIIFSGIITCIAGIVLGFSLAEVNRGDLRPQAGNQYAMIGAIMGLVVGSAQEAVRQLDKLSQD